MKSILYFIFEISLCNIVSIYKIHFDVFIYIFILIRLEIFIFCIKMI